MFGGRKTPLVADGSQEGDGGDQPHAGQLDEEEGAFVLDGHEENGLFEASYLGLSKVECIEIRLDANVFDGGKIEGEPPIAVEGIEQASYLGQGQVMAVQDGMKAILGLSREAHHLGALRNQGPVVAHLLGRHPDRRQQADSMEASEGEGGFLVGFYLGAGDEVDMGRMDEDH